MLKNVEVWEAYKSWRATAPDLVSGHEDAELWKKITGIWYLGAGTIEVTDEVADLIHSMRGKHGLTICKALRAKHGWIKHP